MPLKKDDLTSSLAGMSGSTPIRIKSPDGTEWDCHLETAGLNSKEETRIVLAATEQVQNRGPQENYALPRGTEPAAVGPQQEKVSLSDFGNQEEGEPQPTSQGTSAPRPAQQQEGLSSGNDTGSVTQGTKTTEDQAKTSGNAPTTGAKASEPSKEEKDEFADLDGDTKEDSKSKDSDKASSSKK